MQTMLPVIMGQIPAGCSANQIKHYLQLHESSRFCQYDHGKDNQKIYGRSTPPDYALDRVTAPVALYYAQNDYLADVEDVQRLAKKLPNVVVNHIYPNKKFNHIDMLWGISSRRTVQPQLLEVMQLWEAGGPQNGTKTTSVSPNVDIIVDQEEPKVEENYVK